MVIYSNDNYNHNTDKANDYDDEENDNIWFINDNSNRNNIGSKYAK